MNWEIDGTLYPDIESPSQPLTLSEQIDFLSRLCSAWDFGLLPDWGVVEEVRNSRWRQAVDTCRLLTAHSYHLLRKWHNLPTLPYLGSPPDYVKNDPNLHFV